MQRDVLGDVLAARAAHRRLFNCPTAYTEALRADGLPVPPRLNAELRMYGGVLAVSGIRDRSVHAPDLAAGDSRSVRLLWR